MKLCPQCAFIYEDHQRICDMDGNELVSNSPPVIPEPSAPSRLMIEVPAKSEVVSQKASSKRLPVLVILLVVLATLFSLLIFAQARRARSAHAVQPLRSEQAAAPQPQAASANKVSTTAPTSPPEPSLESSEELAPANVETRQPLTRTQLASSPVAAGVSSANASSSSTIRLTNGANIKADEVWERKEGVWYRQGGVVTFIQRNRVRKVERLAPRSAQPKTAAANDTEKNKANERSAQNQLRLRQLEAIDAKSDKKKQSRVTSFLKLTGRILKKPFKS